MNNTPQLAITSAVLRPESELVYRCISSWGMTIEEERFMQCERLVRCNTPDDNLGVTGSLQWLYENTTAPIIAFLHSDVEIFEHGWDERVLKEFDDPKVGVVGFGGSLGHGDPDIYKVPYQLQQLRRIDYLSNTNDAEAHGTRFTGSQEVAVLDGFALVVRRELLDKLGGWPVKDLPFHSYDYWICCSAHLLRYTVRLVGVKCHHYGGASSTTPDYQKWCLEKLGRTDATIHEESHKYVYERFRQVLPYRCKP